MTDDNLCRAQWQRIAYVTFLAPHQHGVFLTCGMPTGHDGKHKAWCWGTTAGVNRKALVEW